ncbi:16490_t:CDS:2 [Entrophospora sp. SA101]|nr:16490_t:CDS:2 [Entrophospora sp. SA101]
MSLDTYNVIRDLAECAVNLALRTPQVVKGTATPLQGMQSGYDSIVGLKALKALKTEKETVLDNSHEKIEQNFNVLKVKLGNPGTATDVSLYNTLKKNLEKFVVPSKLTWWDPEANTVLSNESVVVQKLNYNQKHDFLEPCENMKCVMPESLLLKCENFVRNFSASNITNDIMNSVHDKTWKEKTSQLEIRVEQLLEIIEEVWNNLAFENSTTCSEQSEGMYICDVVMPLIWAGILKKYVKKLTINVQLDQGQATLVIFIQRDFCDSQI